MGESRGTCGCLVPIGTPAVYIKDRSRVGERAISYPVLCSHCLAFYRSHRLVLDTEAEREAWLQGEDKDG